MALESLRVVARLELAPARRPRGAAEAAAIVGAGAWTTGPVIVIIPSVRLVVPCTPAWHPIPGVRSSAIFVIVTAAVVVTLAHLTTAVAIAIAATAATPCASWMHSGTSLGEISRFKRCV